MRVVVTDSHTGRVVEEDEGRYYTRLPGDEATREVDTFTVRRLLSGGTSVIVAYAPPPEPSPRLLLVG